jgi:hypothetical protein
MKFRVRFRPYSTGDWPELVGIFDLLLKVSKADTKEEQEKQDLQAAFNYLKVAWMNVDIISIEKLH